MGLGAALMLAVVLAWPMEVGRYLAMDASPVLRDRDGTPLHVYLNQADHWCFPRALDEISPRLIDATLAAEDKRFYSHVGVDPVAIIRAAWQNATRGRTVSGASTLTMQLVKMTDGGERSFLTKIQQAVQALRLELRVEKDEILNAYLNRAPYGMNLMGCEAAALRYFGRPSSELLLSEAALLAALPKAPSALMPIAHSGAAKARRDFVLARMVEDASCSAADAERAAARPVTASWHEYPVLAPHLAARYADTAAEAGSFQVTVSEAIQARVEERLRYHVARSGGAFTNGAVIVVDVGTSEVLAHAGSVDFFDTPGGGQVDATRALRSPGSTLKPFTYALAMDSQQLYPSEVLYDGPLDYGLYNPANFDGDYAGLVNVGEALRASLNVPAITTLERIGASTLYRHLKAFGFTGLVKPADYYGLGLTLGSCEATLEELAAAYTAIANLGAYRELQFTPSGEDSARPTMMSEGVAVKIFELLRQPLPGELDRILIPTAGRATPAAWKTGTSSDYRDAWAIVFDRQHVVAVWMGNNDSRSSPYLVGYTAALPLAAELFRAMSARHAPAWPRHNGVAQEVSVCAVSGLPATALCPGEARVWYPNTQLLHRRCRLHQRAGDRVVTRWPGAPLHWNLATVSRGAPNNAEAKQRETGLRILEPADKAEFLLTGVAAGDRIRLRSSRDAAGPVHWYVNDRYLGSGSDAKPLYFALAGGDYRVTCLGADGALDTTAFRVVSPSD